jgi:hypothetical protein
MYFIIIIIIIIIIGIIQPLGRFGQRPEFRGRLPLLSPQCTYNVILRSVPVTIVVVEKVMSVKYYECVFVALGSVSQPSGRGPVPGPGTNYTGPREARRNYNMLQDFISPVIDN